MRLSVIVPCFNEADNVPMLLEKFLPVISRLPGMELADNLSVEEVEVIFVDDGSTDDSWPALNSAFSKVSPPGVSFIFTRHKQNMGLGAALRTGFVRSTGSIVVTTDSDGTYSFDKIPDLLVLMGEGVDMVTASPYHPDGGVDGVPAYRLILSRGSSLIYRILVNWRVNTYTALFRAYRSEVIKNVPFSSDSYLAGTELMVKGMLSGYTVAEFPTVLHQRNFGVSKAKILRTISDHLAFQGKVLLYRLHLADFNGNKMKEAGDRQWM